MRMYAHVQYASVSWQRSSLPDGFLVTAQACCSELQFAKPGVQSRPEVKHRRSMEQEDDQTKYFQLLALIMFINDNYFVLAIIGDPHLKFLATMFQCSIHHARAQEHSYGTIQ